MVAFAGTACSEGSGAGAHRTPTQIDPDDERRAKEAAAARGTGAPARTVAERVDAAGPKGLEPFDAAVLPVPARRRLADVPLPVLLPAPDAIGGSRAYASAVATRGPAWYSVAVPGDDIHLSIFGTREAAVRPDVAASAEPAPEGSVPNDALRIGRTHGIVQATFRRFGASYSVEVECTDPAGDRRCTEDAFLRRLVAAMQRLGGER